MPDRDNVKFSKPNFTTDGEFYYSMLEDSDVLQVKVDDGKVSFSFPLDTSISETIKSLEFDGIFFWTLEDHKNGGDVDGFTIRKWAIDDFIVKQIQKFDFVDNATHTYRASSFAVEYYRTSVGLGNNDGGGNGYMGVNLQKEMFLYDTSKLVVGDIVYLVKRWTPTHQRYGTNNVEQMMVNEIISSTKVGFSSNTVVDPYGDGRGWRGHEASPSAGQAVPPDEVCWTKYIWVFNSYSPGPTSTPALYKINAYNGSNIAQYSGTQYGSVNGSVFYTKYSTSSKTANGMTNTYNTAIVTDSEAGGKQTYIIYVKASSAIFHNATTNTTDRSMNAGNVKVDTISIWDVYDMAVTGVGTDVVLLKLQTGATYKNSGGTIVDEAWSNYNYDRVLIRRHVESIAITATPSIVPITTGTASIAAYLKDQYNNTVPAGVAVYFSDDDSGAGSASLSPQYPPTPAYTDAFGRAYTTFYAGGTEKDVKITATSTWVDPS